MLKFRHAGAIAGRSTRPGAFYFPVPRDKGRKNTMKTAEKIVDMIHILVSLAVIYVHIFH